MSDPDETPKTNDAKGQSSPTVRRPRPPTIGRVQMSGFLTDVHERLRAVLSKFPQPRFPSPTQSLVVEYEGSPKKIGRSPVVTAEKKVEVNNQAGDRTKTKPLPGLIPLHKEKSCSRDYRNRSPFGDKNTHTPNYRNRSRSRSPHAIKSKYLEKDKETSRRRAETPHRRHDSSRSRGRKEERRSRDSDSSERREIRRKRKDSSRNKGREEKRRSRDSDSSERRETRRKRNDPASNKGREDRRRSRHRKSSERREISRRRNDSAKSKEREDKRRSRDSSERRHKNSDREDQRNNRRSIWNRNENRKSDYFCRYREVKSNFRDYRWQGSYRRNETYFNRRRADSPGFNRRGGNFNRYSSPPGGRRSPDLYVPSEPNNYIGNRKIKDEPVDEAFQRSASIKKEEDTNIVIDIPAMLETLRRCPSCPHLASSWDVAKTHLVAEHKEEICLFCLPTIKVYPHRKYSSKLNQHFFDKHDPLKTGKAKCILCERQFTLNGFILHVKTHFAAVNQIEPSPKKTASAKKVSMKDATVQVICPDSPRPGPSSGIRRAFRKSWTRILTPSPDSDSTDISWESD